MRVLITGGYGFIGAWIIRNLLAQGDEVWVYDLKEDPRRLRAIMPEAEVRKVVFVPGDVTDLPRLQKALADFRISHIIHLAGLQVPTCRVNPILGAQVNVIGTLTVFEAIRLAGDQIKRLVYASSSAVLGPPEKYPKGPLADDVKLLPSTHYGHFKICNEGNAAIYFQENGISSIGLRPWTVYGVGRDLGMTSEPTKAIKSVAINRPYHISYGGWQDLQYVDDVARIFVRCLMQPDQGAKSYNIRGTVVDLPPFHKAFCKV
ncbi:MAG: NAD-dependent epimerase/dehydratase family protein [Planctomycetes bacterium]|nr:NAD-dependent epimerase/dehydratase family protein [Planctomycetota bacterium]